MIGDQAPGAATRGESAARYGHGGGGETTFADPDFGDELTWRRRRIDATTAASIIGVLAGNMGVTALR